MSRDRPDAGYEQIAVVENEFSGTLQGAIDLARNSALSAGRVYFVVDAVTSATRAVISWDGGVVQHDDAYRQWEGWVVVGGVKYLTYINTLSISRACVEHVASVGAMEPAFQRLTSSIDPGGFMPPVMKDYSQLWGAAGAAGGVPTRESWMLYADEATARDVYRGTIGNLSLADAAFVIDYKIY